MGSIETQTSPLRLFLFDTARTNCHCFYKLFSSHPQLAWGEFYHGFSSAALYGPERIQQHLRHGEGAEQCQIEWGTQYPSENWKTYESSLEQLRVKIDEAENRGKVFFGKEHVLNIAKQDLMIASIRREPDAAPLQMRNNPTYLPDDILDTLTPIFVIRHPILMVDSIQRAQQPIMHMLPTDEDFEAMGTLRWCLMLFEYFKSRGSTPALVDSEDFIYNTKPTLDKLCNQVGIDPSGWKDTWDPIPREHWPDHKAAVAFTGDMMGSSGIERRPKKPVESLDAQTEMWKTLYGDEIAKGLRKRVETEMPIYEYLKAFKISPQ